MSSSLLPRLPIPEPLRGIEIPSFTNYSIVVRLPEIARRVIAENELIPDHLARMQALVAEIPSGKIRPLEIPLAPDALDWQRYVEPYLGWDWLHVPWFFAEAYFYVRILEATGYYYPGPGQGMDPFALQKRLGLDSSLPTTQALSARLDQSLQALPSRHGAATVWQAEDLLHLLSVDLWGNQVDLSLWPVSHGKSGGEDAFRDRQEHVLVDDSPALVAFLSTERRRVDFLLDNAGFELICDLALADYLLHACRVQQVTFHVKAQPTFVSDAMAKDVLRTVERLEDETHREVQEMAGRLRQALSSGRLVLRDDFTWTSPLPGWEMPAALRQELGQASLIISKGDANYRRLLGDRHWPFTAPLGEILSYMPAPVLLLRTLKSENRRRAGPRRGGGSRQDRQELDDRWPVGTDPAGRVKSYGGENRCQASTRRLTGSNDICTKSRRSTILPGWPLP